MEINRYIDHTLLSPDATEDRIRQICEEALKYKFASVCVNSCYTSLCASLLKGSSVNVCTVVGFPLGAMSTSSKAFEARQAVSDGSNEIDMVINIGYLKDKKDDLVVQDIKAVKNACSDAHLKVIIETCLLTEEEKIRACRLSVEAGADFVKTSTGFSKGGATVDDVKLMRKTVGTGVGVKASGGIRDYKTAAEMVDAGANRLGCSASVKIVSDAE